MNKKTTKPAAKAAANIASTTQPKEPAIPKGAPKDKSFSQLVAGVMLSPAFNGANVVQSFGKGLINDEAKFFDIADELKSTFKDVKAGNLSGMEQMLVAQATALQSMFTSLALRAQAQTQMPHLEKFMGLALKAQAQSRATIQALVELKYPRQVAFVKQLNTTTGAQQINNGTQAITRTEEKLIAPNEVKALEDERDGSTYLDAGAATAPGREDQAVAAVAAKHGTTD
ncbi:MAG: hypothetical protein JZU58_24000 [Curvibacter lanceolatus]|uniref:hypothetical protein n=1 Tax=Curvibacter lanceolatus TaxID=86182 RepID=UPI0023568467|nr:hypothetical protein [Curvibacter lanceolatus]MBV5295412.1 hypothetical protein [Curvibacter lanceolatus]